MPRRWPTLASLLLAVSACSSPNPTCTTRRDCPSGLVCVNNECRQDSQEGGPDSGSDGGGPDSGPSDGGSPDGGGDGGLDGSSGCGLACGEVDVDGDGTIDEEDLAALPERTTADACLREAADVNRNGMYDADDAHALRALVSGSAAGPCTACGGCGDVDGDGSLDAADAEAIATMPDDWVPSPCALLAADVDRDGSISVEDAWLVAAMADGRATVECAACPTLQCGDANGDEAITLDDVFRVVDAASGAVVLTPCEYLLADVVRDGRIDRRDVFAAQQVLVAAERSSTAPGACERCAAPVTCGDVNGDGVVNLSDTTTIVNAVTSGEPNVCRRSVLDLNADGALNARDAHIAVAIRTGEAEPAARCPICSDVCGDVNQDGGVSGPDLVRFSSIRAGTRVPICERDAADINGDGNVDARDERLLTALSTGSVSANGFCPVCTGICGDLNQDGMVTAADRSVVTAIEGGTRTARPCELDDGDINHDGVIDAIDRDLITAIIGGMPPAMACGR